jgi:RHS repeat-associated protein
VFSPTPMLLAMRHFPAGAEGQAYWVHLDGRGSVAGITQHQGQSTHNYRYDAYGQVLPAEGNWTDPHNHYTFLGKEWDEHLGLYEFGVRLYDPWAGVWLTREPLPGDAWEPRTWHRYGYAFANPANSVDPYGQQAGGLGLCAASTFPIPGSGVTGCVYLAADLQGQVALVIVKGGGGYVPYGAGLGLSVLGSNIYQIHELEGWSATVGGSASFVIPTPAGPVPAYAGPDIGLWSTASGARRWAAILNVGVGFKFSKKLPAIPVEIHGYASHTHVISLFALPELWRRIFSSPCTAPEGSPRDSLWPYDLAP